MSLFQQFSISIKSYFQTFNFINQHKLWAWLLIPGLINLAIFIGFGFVALSYSDDLTNYFVELFNLEDEDGISILFWTMLILIRMLVLFIFFFIYKYIILILMSPALALYSEKIHTIQIGREISFNTKTFVNNIFRGIAIAVKSLVKEMILTVLILLLSFTGILAPIVPVLLFVVQSYYYGFSMMDYKSELNGLTMKQSSQLVWENKGIAIGNGVVFSLTMLIPFFGALLAPMIALNAMFLAVENKKG